MKHMEHLHYLHADLMTRAGQRTATLRAGISTDINAVYRGICLTASPISLFHISLPKTIFLNVLLSFSGLRQHGCPKFSGDVHKIRLMKLIFSLGQSDCFTDIP